MKLIPIIACLLILLPLFMPKAAAETSAMLLARAKNVLAKIDGEFTLAGLKEAVEIRRDQWGIAHIHAKNADDLFFAQGFVAAQDRLFQIDIWRRQGAGEMAEILGPDAFEADRFARLIKYRGDMEAEWTAYSPDTKAIAVAFTKGINACIDSFGDNYPIEFHLLGIRPKKWQPEDVLLRMSGIYMSQNFRNEVQRAELIARVGLEKARLLAPVDPPRDYEAAVGIEALKGIDKRILAGYEAATKALSFKPSKSESNNWVVSGQRSASGKPLLASDPHRAIALPSLRYLVHLQAPGWNVIGSGEPALPGVAIGHNERIGWGFTIVGIDQADFFVEEMNPANPGEYKVGERWEKVTIHRESIAVKGEKEPRKVELRSTRHGPVLHEDGKHHRACALKWVGSEPGGAAYLGSLAVGRATNQKEFLRALGSWKIPGLNFVYADVDGNIGWIAAGGTPIRPRHDGLLPVPGNGGYEWAGSLAVEEYPQSFNPKAGFLATANHKILPEGYKHQIGYEFSPPYRFQRIHQALASRDKWELKDFQPIQHDVTSIPALALARLLKGVDLQDSGLEPFAKRLIDWNGQLNAEGSEGTIYSLWKVTLQDAFYARQVDKDLMPNMAALNNLPVMIQALETADPRWFGKDAKATRDDLLCSTFREAVAKLKKLPEAQQARWGASHTATFKHPLATLNEATGIFNLGPVERPGDSSTPNNTRYDENYQQVHGATYRHLLDLADWDRALATSAPGQSGQPGSPHYDNLLSLWARGEYFPLAYSREKIEEVTKHKLVLKPK